jgi:hypothetical protein
MGQHEPLQRRVATTTSTPARAPARDAVHAPPAAEPARSLGDLERAARAGPRLADVPTHAPSRAGQPERVRGVGGAVQRKAATSVGGGGVIQCQGREEKKEKASWSLPGMRTTTKTRYKPLDAESDKAASEAEIAGRSAKHDAGVLASSRTKDFAKASGRVAYGLGAGAVDIAAPGAGTAMVGGLAAYDTREKRRRGKKFSKTEAAQVAVGAPIVPVPMLGPVLSTAPDVYKAGKAVFQSEKDRSIEKSDLASTMADEGLESIEGIEKQIESIKEQGPLDPTDKPKLAKLEKAKKRLARHGGTAETYVGHKEDMGTARLLGGKARPSLASSDTTSAMEELIDEG